MELVPSYLGSNASSQFRQVQIPNWRYQTDSPSELTQSGRVGHQRSSTVSLGCPRLPPLNLGGMITYPTVEETTLREHSSSASDYPSSSRSTSAVYGSGFRVSSENSWSSRRSSAIAAPSVTGYTSLLVSCLEIESQQPKRPSILVNDVASGFSLIVPETVWDPGRSLKAIKSETLESVIQYLLVCFAGRLCPVSR